MNERPDPPPLWLERLGLVSTVLLAVALGYLLLLLIDQAAS